MKKLFPQVASTILLLIIMGCSAPRKATVQQYKSMDTITVSARNNPSDIYRAAAPRVWEIINTDVALSFDFLKKEATGLARLLIQPYAFPADTLTLDAKGMSIASVSAAFSGNYSDAGTPLSFSYDTVQLKINVSGLFEKRKTVTIRIGYTAKPYAQKSGGSAAITSDRGLYFINTDRKIPGKPMQVWTQGETESNSRWLPTIDKPNQRTTTMLQLTVPDTLQTLSNGKLTRSIKLANGLKQDIWSMDKPIQVYAIMFAIGRYEKQTEEWRDNRGDRHDVRYYTEPQYARYAKAMFANTPEMIETFSKATGVQYPWDTYSQIVARDYVSGAMENTSASLFGEFANKNFRQLADGTNEDVVSHELFHQWFGDYVTAESWGNLTVNESFATYGELIWRKHKRGAASADELAYADLSRYLEASKRSDPPLVRHYFRDKEEMFDRVSYQKGGAILRYINGIIGDTLFNRAMSRYLHANALRSAEATHWRLALEEATGRDWTQFFDEWYYRGGHPVLRVKYDYDDAAQKLRVTVRQNGSPDSSIKYHLPLKAEIISEKSRRTEDWTINDRSQTFTYSYTGGSRPLIIPDAAHWLPGFIKEDKRPAEWLAQMRESDNFISKRLALNAALAAASEPVSVQIVQLAIKDGWAGIRNAAFTGLQKIQSKAWQDALRSDVMHAAEFDGDNQTRASAIRLLRAWDVRTSIPVLSAAVSDSSYAVAGSALNALIKMDADAAYSLAKPLLPTSPKSELYGAVWNAIAAKGASADLALFNAEAGRTWGGERAVVVAALQQYALATKDDVTFGDAVRLLGTIASSEESKTYRYAAGATLVQIRNSYDADVRKRTEKSAASAQRRTTVAKVLNDLIAAETDPEVAKAWKEGDERD